MTSLQSVRENDSMTAGAPWSVKGIDPKAREVAKDLARRSGMTLGEWLNHVILEDDAAASAVFAEPSPRTSLEAERPKPRAASEGRPPPDLAPITQALDRLTDHIEASETRTGLTITSVERSVRQAVARIETAEREQLAVANRFENTVERVSVEQSRLADRLRRLELESAGPRSTEALRTLEQSLSRVSGQVYESESRTRDSIAALEARLQRAESASTGDSARLNDEAVRRLAQRLSDAETRTAEALETLHRSLAALDARLRTTEGGGEAESRRLQSMAADLKRQVEGARAEVAERLKSVDPAKLESRFGELAAQVEASERRSAAAVQKMGRQVLSMAETLNRRVDETEARSAEAIAQVGGEMARVAGAVEDRLGRAERAQAEALQRLSGEIGQITERLSDRMLIAERRAAEAIDDVGVQVARVTERLQERQELSAKDLVDHIRESEARTARLLEETRERLEQRFTESALAPAAPPPSAAVFGPELFSRAEPEDDVAAVEIAEPKIARVAEPPVAPEPREFASSDDFAPIPEPEEDLFGLDQPEPPPAEDQALSTREVIQQARAAARAAASSSTPTERLQVKAKANWRTLGKPAGAGLFSGVRPRKAPSSTLQTALLVAGGAAFLSVGAAGVVLMEGPPSHSSAEIAASDQSEGAPRAAIALAPQALGPVTPFPDAGEGGDSPRPPAQLANALATAYASAVKGLDAHEPGALARLKAIAEAGHPPAQFYLGKLYETGAFGVAQSFAEARLWTARAAEGGDSAAMHNLALFYFRGEGGPQDLASAVRWFRRAADDGVVDSQYNLGLLYESGSGVDRNLPEAYKWFTIAADGGDPQARASAAQLRSRLTAAQMATAERAAVTFHATTNGRSDLAPITPRAVASAQRAAAAARLSDFAR